MPYLTIPQRDLRIFYVVNSIPPPGPGDAAPQNIDPGKPAVVLIHASMASCETFDAQLRDPRLTHAFNLIAFDARLHGRTIGGHRVSHTIEDSANCLVAALDQLDLESYSVVGEGFHGATIASWIASKRPDKVKAICLVSPGGFVERPETVKMMTEEWFPAAIANKDGNGDRTGTVEREQIEAINDYFFGNQARQVERRAAFGEAFQKRYGRSNLDSHDLRHLVSFFNRQPIPPSVLASIKSAVLIIQGEDDAIASPLSEAERWRDSFQSAKNGADLRIIAGAPHLLLYTDSSIANRFLLQFIQRNL